MEGLGVIGGMKEELDELRERNAKLEADLAVARGEILELRERMTGFGTVEGEGGESAGGIVAANSDSTVILESRNDNNNISSSSQKDTEESARKSRKRKSRSSAREPGQSRYWTSHEHKLFLEALQEYGHKDLRNISEYVGTRNMTQVRTHAQKYFMRLMKEAKKLTNGTVESTSHMESSEMQQEEDKRNTQEVRSVPADCGVSLLSLVAQETCLV